MNDVHVAVSGRQPTLKPQDIAVVLALALIDGSRFTYASHALRLQLSVGEVHAAMRRAEVSRLILLPSGETPQLVRTSTKEFVLYGLKYAFPAIHGSLTRGLPTGLAGTNYAHAVTSEAVPPVWPHPDGRQRGFAVTPLYPTAPSACLRDPVLHELLAMVDALRLGSVREREIAAEFFAQRLL